jgi:hypothetical protein
MQKPLSLPLVAQLPLNCIAQPLQNLHIEMTSIALSRRYELMMHQTIGVRECNVQWFLHHDNAPSRTSLVVQQLHAEKNIPVITQPPYSPGLTPSDFWLFPTLKMSPKGMRFTTMEDIKPNAMAELRKIPKEAFGWCFQQWQDRWSKCVCVCVHKGPMLEVIR